MRCMHEAQLCQQNCFITLTFADEHLPEDYSVHVRTWQLFMKKVRKHYEPKKIRFYACGEYGEANLRPHYHAILFNHDFTDKRLWKTDRAGNRLYTSKELTELWGFGHCTTGDVTFESAAYVARYVMKKLTVSGDGQHVVDHYYTRIHPVTKQAVRVQPEFCVSSRRPGLGAPWLERYKTDVYPSDFVVSRGMKMAPPRFYDQKLTEEELTELKRHRKLNSHRFKADNTKERLAVRETVKKSKLSLLKRTLG